MQETKFRVWDKKNKCWIEPTEDTAFCDYLRVITFDGRVLEGRNPVLDCCCKHIDDDKSYELANMELVQYTGLKDKNGKEVYKGDIVRMAGKSRQPRWEIVWYENGWQMLLIQSKPEHPKNYRVKLSSDRVIEFDEIIGNIYENPGLRGQRA